MDSPSLTQTQISAFITDGFVRIERAFAAVIADAHRVPGAVWSLGKTLVDNAVRARG